MKKGNVLKRLGAMFLAATLALAPVAGVMASGLQDLPTVPDPNKKGSITVHKYTRSTYSNIVGDGNEITDAEELEGLGTVAPGVKFELYQVDETKFTVKEDTEMAEVLVMDGVAYKYLKPVYATGNEKTTDTNGEITWPDLAIGYYVLIETNNDALGVGKYEKAVPSMIALPYAVGDDVWNYNLHVYPKNVEEVPLQKKTDPSVAGYGLGQTVGWTYVARPEFDKLYDENGGTPLYGTYKIIDALDKRLDFDKADFEANADDLITFYDKFDAPVDVASWAIPTDMTCTYVGSTNTITWELTNAGISKLVAGGVHKIEIKFDTKINDKVTEDLQQLIIENGGEINWKNSDGTTGEPFVIPDVDKPSVALYSIEIIKTDRKGIVWDGDIAGSKILQGEGKTVLLNGAVFRFALSEEQAKKGEYIEDDNGNPIEITTGAQGNGVSPSGCAVNLAYGWGMYVGVPLEYGNDQELDATNGITIWLVEVQAPDSYVRWDQPIPATIKWNNSPPQTSVMVEVKNYKKGDPDNPAKWNLPLTGGMGTVIFYVIGTIVMLGSVLLFMKSKRRKESC